MSIFEKYDAQIIAAIIALIGVFLGLFWQQLVDYLRRKSARKTVVRRLLYLMFEIRYVIDTNRPKKKEIEMILCWIEEDIQQRFPEEVRDSFQRKLEEIIKGRLKDVHSDYAAELHRKYLSAIDDFSSFAPFVAYSISANSRKLDFQELVENLQSDWNSGAVPEEHQQEAKQIGSVHSDLLLRSMIEDLEEDIMDVAKLLGLFSIRKTRKLLLRYSDSEQEIKFRKFYEETVRDNILNLINEGSNKSRE